MGLVFPEGLGLTISPKDAAAPTLEAGDGLGLLPPYEACLSITDGLRTLTMK